MSYRVRFTEAAEEDLVRLYEFSLSLTDDDYAHAESAFAAIVQAIDALKASPFSYRKASSSDPLIRELVIPFGASGYVALYEVDGADSVTILAVRHQRENDYR